MSKLLSLLTIVIFLSSSHAGNKCVQRVISAETLILGNSASFALLSETGITDVPTSSIGGNVGCYPITGAAVLLTCPEVTGIIYQADAAGDGCFVTDAALLLSAISDMQTAYNYFNNLVAWDFIELYAGDISGKTLAPGLYKWSTGVLINTDVILSGSPIDVWIFQIAGNLDLAGATSILLQGGAKSKNVFWVVAGPSVNVGAVASFQGSVLAKEGISLGNGASINGRLLAQTAVTLQMNSVVIPSP